MTASFLPICACVCGWALAGPATLPTSGPAATGPASGPTATAPATAPATAAATRPASGPSLPSVAELIARIREAPDIRTASKAYAEAREQDRTNVQLYRVFMRKALKLGHPKIALYGARELTKLSPDDGTAWGVIGYDHARRGAYFQALTVTARAMSVLATDASVQQNLGYLLAWYDHVRDPPALSATTKRLLSRHRRDWDEFPEVARTFKEVDAPLQQRAKELEALAARADETKQRLREIDEQYRDLEKEIRQRADELRDLRKEIAYLESRRKAEKDERERKRLHQRQLDCRDRLDREQEKIRELERQRDRLRRQRIREESLARQVLGELETAGRELAAQRRDSLADVEWLPPAVDGVVTPEGEAPGKPVQIDRPDGPTKPEALLQLARLLLKNNLKDKAAKRLREVIRHYPDSPAAKEARELLRKHKLIEAP